MFRSANILGMSNADQCGHNLYFIPEWLEAYENISWREISSQILPHTITEPLMVTSITKTRVNVAGERQFFPKLQP